MRHVGFISAILILLASSNRAQAGTRVLFVPPLLVDDGAAWQNAQKAVLRVQQELSRMPQFNVVAHDGPRPPSSNREALDRAQDMLRSGEKAYLAFDHAKAADTLSCAAELLAPLVENLDSADMRLLSRARFLEGTAWAEAHRPEQAMDAFEALLEMVPDQPMDDSMLPPRVQPLWHDAVERVQAHSTVRVIVSADPVGADVSLDGRWRGRAPLTLASVPRGKHRLTVSAPGYLTATEQADIDDATLTRDIALDRAGKDDVWRPLSKAAANAPDAAWTVALTNLCHRYKVETVVMVALKRASNGDTWMVLERWQGPVRASIVVLTAPDKKLDLVPDAIEALLGHNASPVYLPRPKSAPLNFDNTIFGVPSDADEMPAAESSFALWGTAGKAVVPGFGAALGGGLGATWAMDDAWSFDLMAEATHSSQPSGSRADEVLARIVFRRGLRWRRMAVSGGLHAGAAGLFTNGVAGAGVSTFELVPDAGLLARFDFDVGDWVLISVMGLAQVDALGLTDNRVVDQLTFEVTYHGMLGLGWRW